MTVGLERVRKIAQKVSKKYNLTVPVDLNALIASKCEYVEHETFPGAIEAFTELDRNPPRINISSKIYAQRKCFTIAHELGHVFIPWHNGVDALRAKDNEEDSLLDRNELEADTFASELLLPEKLMKKYFNSSNDKSAIEIIENITQSANVSVLACFHGMRKYWFPENLLFYARSQDKFWKECRSEGFLFEFFRMNNAETHRFSLYEHCALEMKEYQLRSYAIVHFKFMKLPSEEDVLKKYHDAEMDMALFFENLTDGMPARAIPYIGEIVNFLPCRTLILVELDGYEPKEFCSHSQQRFSLCWAKASELHPDIMSKCLGYTFSEIILDNIGKLSFIYAPCDIARPSEHSSNPNSLLTHILNGAYNDPITRLSIGRKVNGIIGGSNNRTMNRDLDTFYADMLYRMCAEDVLWSLVEHPDFPAYLKGKLMLL